jgi:hypothetical protein
MVKLLRYPLVIGHYLTKRSFIAILDLPLPFQISGGQSKILNKQIYMFRVEETRQSRTKVRVFQLSKSDCDQPIWDMPDCSNMCPQTLQVQWPNLKISNWDLHLLNDILNQLDTGNKSPRHCVVAQGCVGNRNCDLLHSYNCPFINGLPSMVISHSHRICVCVSESYYHDFHYYYSMITIIIIIFNLSLYIYMGIVQPRAECSVSELAIEIIEVAQVSMKLCRFDGSCRCFTEVAHVSPARNNVHVQLLWNGRLSLGALN